MHSLVTNLSSLRAQKHLQKNQRTLGKIFSRLSSGQRINRAADDAAGLAISERLKAEIRGIGQARRNAMDGISMLQVAEGALNETNEILIRMKELAIQSANGTLQDAEREYLHGEFTAIIAEIDRIADSTTFNGIALLDGTAVNIPLQIGTGNTPNDVISITLGDAHAAALSAPGVAGLTLATQLGAVGALSVIDLAIDDLSSLRSSMGAIENRLSSTISNLQISEEMLSAANSRIRDADFAAETSKLAQSQILIQAGMSVLSQANQSPQLLLNLLN